MNTKRTFRDIALEVKRLWPNIHPSAQPYVVAMLELNTSDPYEDYWFGTAKEIVQYFLCNATTFRGEDARRIKQELKNLIK